MYKNKHVPLLIVYLTPSPGIIQHINPPPFLSLSLSLFIFLSSFLVPLPPSIFHSFSFLSSKKKKEKKKKKKPKKYALS